MATFTLYQWGPIQFQVYPLNVNEVDHSTMTEWARKEIAGAAVYREWVGESEEQINLRGKVFPHFFKRRSTSAAPGLNETSGLGHLDVMDNMRRLGQAHTLVRGDGWHLGWYVIERLTRGHSFLSANGIGQQVQFEAIFQRVPVPLDNRVYFPWLWGSLRGAG